MPSEPRLEQPDVTFKFAFELICQMEEQLIAPVLRAISNEENVSIRSATTKFNDLLRKNIFFMLGWNKQDSI